MDVDRRIEASQQFARDWIEYEQRTLLTQDLILWPNVKRYLPDFPLNSVCDLGCGTGRLTELLHNHVSARTVGFDLNKTLLDVAKHREKEGLSFGAIDLSTAEVPLSDSSVDLVFSNCLLLHLRAEAFAHLAKEIHRILRIGGIAVLTVTHFAWAKKQYQISQDHGQEITTIRDIGDDKIHEYFRTTSWYEIQLSKGGLSSFFSTDLIIPHNKTLDHRYLSESGTPLFSLYRLQKNG